MHDASSRAAANVAHAGYNSVMSNAGSQSPAELWSVWRIDDNANVFVVREHLTREEADGVVAEFTARGHKQTYWAERDAARSEAQERR